MPLDPWNAMQRKLLSPTLRGLCAFAMGLALAGAAAADDVVLRPRLEPGDRYRLSLRVLTDTSAFSKGVGGETYEELVRLHYQADVTVLEVDAEGSPSRERHDRASLTFQRPGDSGSLFKEGVSLEVARRSDVEISVAGRRLDRKLEDTLADVLEKQFEFTLEPAFLAPGRPVKPGDSWTPNEDLVRRYLLGRGVRVIAFGEGAVATLVQEPREDGRSADFVDYQIPIERFVLTRMPEGAQASKTEARLEGRIQLAPEPDQAPLSARSNLTLQLNGTSRTTAQSQPWGVRTSITIEKSSSGREDLATLAPEGRPGLLR